MIWPSLHGFIAIYLSRHLSCFDCCKSSNPFFPTSKAPSEIKEITPDFSKPLNAMLPKPKELDDKRPERDKQTDHSKQLENEEDEQIE